MHGKVSPQYSLAFKAAAQAQQREIPKLKQQIPNKSQSGIFGSEALHRALLVIGDCILSSICDLGFDIW
jgi:hypothetical protein